MSPSSVPYAAPPKYSPDVMGIDNWNAAMAKHKAWLDSERTTDVGSGEGGMTDHDETTDTPPIEDNNVKTSKRKDSGKPGTFNVYGTPQGTDKPVRVMSQVQAESPGEAVQRAVEKLQWAGTRDQYTNIEARRQRGAGFKGGADKRRRNDPGTGKPERDGVGDEAAQAEFGEQYKTAMETPLGEYGKGKPSKAAQSECEKPEPPQADDIILHRLQSAPLIGKAAEEKIQEIAAQAGPNMDEVKTLIDEFASDMTKTSDEIAQMVEEAMANVKSQQAITINLVQPDGTTTTLDEHTHPLFPEVLRLASKRKPVYLYGPSGTGKTFMAEQVARAMFPDKPDAERYFSLSATMGMSESHLQGWRLPLSAGEFVYIPSEFVKKFENGGVYLLDEVDRSDPNVLAVLNQALANRRLPIPARFEKPYAVMHEDFVMLAAGNTAGTGADRLYTAATRLDEAFLDRFRLGTLRMDYDHSLEEKLVGNTILLRALWYVRKRCAELNIERVISTRSVVEFHEFFGGSTKAEAKQALERVTTTWEKAELNKIDFKVALAA